MKAVAVPDPVDAVLIERMKAIGVPSKEECPLDLVEGDCTASELERTLEQRLAGPFAPLPSDWMDQVRKAADKLEMLTR